MRILYGSQNFGYDKPDSDVDYMDIVYPSWNDIMNNKGISTTIHNKDGSQIKVMDIRKVPSGLRKCDFSFLQILYSKQYIDCEDLRWFIENREYIARANVFSAYRSNSKHIKNMFQNKVDVKNVVRSLVFHDLLVRLLNPSVKFEMYDRSKYDYRIWAENVNQDRLNKEAENILKSLENMKDDFTRLEKHTNMEVNNAVKIEVSRLLMNRVNCYNYRDLDYSLQDY